MSRLNSTVTVLVASVMLVSCTPEGGEQSDPTTTAVPAPAPSKEEDCDGKVTVTLVGRNDEGATYRLATNSAEGFVGMYKGGAFEEVMTLSPLPPGEHKIPLMLGRRSGEVQFDCTLYLTVK